MQPNKASMSAQAKSLYLIIVVALGLFLSSALGQPGANTEVTIRELGASLKSDDMQAAGKLMTEEVAKEFQAMMEASDRLQKARTAFEQALASKFGTRFAKPAESARSRFKNIENISIKEVTQKGSEAQQVKAVVSFKDGSAAEEVTINMTMQNGQWKIALADQQQMQWGRNQTQSMNALAVEVEQMSRDVAGGKYTSSLEAQFAFRELVRKSLAKGAGK